MCRNLENTNVVIVRLLTRTASAIQTMEIGMIEMWSTRQFSIRTFSGNHVLSRGLTSLRQRSNEKNLCTEIIDPYAVKQSTSTGASITVVESIPLEKAPSVHS